MNGIPSRVEFSSVESVPPDLRHKLRSDTHTGSLFIASADVTGAQLQRLIDLADDTHPELDRKAKPVAEAYSDSVTTVDTPMITPKQFTMTRSQMRADIQNYARQAK